ncbi:hypothetical protein [Paractinoplanes atraurantiacus]|nr:hypothetical protein [Actinoplanes atraurantiacus]
MLKIRAALTAVAVACSTVLAVTAGANPAVAGPPALQGGVVLPIDDVADMAVDPVHKRVVLTSTTNGDLHWVSYFGGVQSTTSWLRPGVTGLAFSPDYSTLYVATAWGEILAFDAATRAGKGSWYVGGSLRPLSVAVAGGKLWFGYSTGDGTSAGGFGTLDTATGKVTLHDATVDGISFHGAPELSTPAGDPDTLVVADESDVAETSGNVAVYDVSSGVGVVKGKGRFSDGLLRGVAASADGSSLIGFGTGCPIWKAPSTNPAKRTPAFNNGICRPSAVSVNTDGRVAFGYRNADGTSDIAISPAGSELPAEQFVAPNNDEITHVAWEPGGDRLFALSRTTKPGYTDLTFWPINGSKPVYPTITLDAPATGALGVDLEITGTISVPGAHVELFESSAAAPKPFPVDSAAADAQGRFTLTRKPYLGGTTTYTVFSPGNDTYAPVSASATVEIARNPTSLALSHNNTIYAYGTTVTVLAHLGSTYSNRSVQFWADPYGTEPARLLRWTNVDAKGNLTASLKLTRTTAIQVKFLGDGRNAPASARSVINTRAAVALQPSRQYKAAKIGTVPYRFYRANVHPYFLTTITPYPGRKQRLTLETYTGGTWKVWRVLDLPLNAKGQSAFTLTGTHPVGAKYRVRAGYLTTTSGDSVNYTNYSPYYYFTFTK